MRTIVALTIFIFIGFSSHADCTPQSLSPTAIGLIKPLIELRIKENAKQFNKDGSGRGESQYSADLERKFYSLLNNHSVAGDESLSYLLNVYIGEHYSEELVCEVINRGKRLLPLIKMYKKCIPRIGVEPLPEFVQGSGTLPGYAEEGISKGEKCEHHYTKPVLSQGQ